MLEKLRSLWNTAKTTLHYGPSTEPLWTHIVELLHTFEARLTALESGLKDNISGLLANAEVSLSNDFNTMTNKELQAFKVENDSLIAKLEARIAALEGHPAVSIPPLAPVATTEPVQSTTPAASPVLEPVIAPTETLHFPDTAAEGANDSPPAAIQSASPSDTNLTGGAGDQTQPTT